MSYIQKTLASDETLLHEGKVSKWSMFHLYCAAAIFGVSIILLPISVLLLLLAYFKIKSTEMAVTSKRIISKTGLFTRDADEIRLSRVESVSVKQGIFGRMFGYGEVTVIGTGGNNAVMKGVADPLKFRAEVDRACERSGLEVKMEMAGGKRNFTDAEIGEILKSLAVQGGVK